MQQVISIMLGGALGAVARFWMVGITQTVFGKGFPYGVLGVNVIGSFLIGLFSIWFLQKGNQDESLLRLMIVVGFLGSFTTFSTFSLDTLNLLLEGHTFRAFLNIIANVLICLLAALGGVQLARILF
jgi:CrcB protein